MATAEEPRRLTLPPTTALVISECQRGIVDPAGTVPALAHQVTARKVLDRVAELAEAFRAAVLPVVYCNISHRPDLAGVLPNSLLGAMTLKRPRMLAGTDDVEVPEPASPRPGDFISARATGLTAFYGTDLDATLRLQGVSTLVVCGVSTDVALPGLALEAVNRGYTVVIPEDATAGTSKRAHEFMTSNLLAVVARVTSTAGVLVALRALTDRT